MKLGRNDPCWCGSGEKFKKCHLGRDIETPPTLQEQIENLRNAKSALCLHPEASLGSCTEIIKAHSLQRAGQLESIAHDDKVYSCDVDLVHSIKSNGRRLPILVSTKAASVFTGFCGRHDKLLFRDIEEKPFELSRETVFLLMFRAQAREFYTKLYAINAESFVRKSDRGHSVSRQIVLQKKVFDPLYEGVRLGLEDGRARLNELNKIFLEKQISRVNYYALHFPSQSPFLTCGTFNPQHDVNSNFLQDISLPFPVSSIDLNILNVKDKCYVIFSWLDKDEVVERFVESIDNSDSKSLDLIALWTCFSYLENTFCNPKWWDGLSESQVATVETAMRYGIDVTLDLPFISYARFDKRLIDLGVPERFIS